MTISERFLSVGEYVASGAFEEENRSLFYRKALALRRFYENCPLPEYTGKPLYPSGPIPFNTNIAVNYMKGIFLRADNFDKENQDLMQIFRKDFDIYSSSVPTEHTVAGNMWTHAMPNYERILQEGLLAYISRIEKMTDKDMREGLLHLVAGIERYNQRCVAYLQSVNADEQLIRSLKKVPMRPAEDIFDAIVGWNFILYLDTCDNLGCLAKGLLPYYKGEDVTKWIANLYDNLDSNNAWSVSLPGDNNPLTIQCLEASKGKRRPMIELLVDENTPEPVWEKAFEVIRTMNGQPAFYNKKEYFEGIKQRFPRIPQEDIEKFCGGGCTETMLSGLSGVGSLDAGINTLLVLEKTVYDYLEKAVSFDDFYNKYLQNLEQAVDIVTAEISNSQLSRAKHNPLPMRTLLIDDCIDNGVEFNNGGARYKWSIVSFAGLINAIDSLLSIKEFVFNKKNYTAKEFIEKLRADDEAFIEQMKGCEIAFGRDDERADIFAGKFSQAVFSMLDNKKPAIGEAFISASVLFNAQAFGGSFVGATPDGRRAKSPLADSVSAIFEKDINGPTALLRSVTALDLSHALGTPVLNFSVQPDYNNDVLKGLILGYIQSGGMQMQISCVSKEILLDAYDHPEKYPNLVVRVAGFSEYFINLSDELKKAVIARSIQNLK